MPLASFLSIHKHFRDGFVSSTASFVLEQSVTDSFHIGRAQFSCFIC